jgi:hypothetical protein
LALVGNPQKTILTYVNKISKKIIESDLTKNAFELSLYFNTFEQK